MAAGRGKRTARRVVGFALEDFSSVSHALVKIESLKDQESRSGSVEECTWDNNENEREGDGRLGSTTNSTS